MRRYLLKVVGGFALLAAMAYLIGTFSPYPEMKNERMNPAMARMAIWPQGIAAQLIEVPVMIFFGSKTNWMSENGRARMMKIAHRAHFPTSASCA